MHIITGLSILAILSAIVTPTAMFANYPTTSANGTNSSSYQQQMHSDKDEDNHDDSDQELIGARDHETISERMNRQAREVREASRANQRFNSTPNREWQNSDRSNSRTNSSSTTNRNTQR